MLVEVYKSVEKYSGVYRGGLQYKTLQDVRIVSGITHL